MPVTVKQIFNKVGLEPQKAVRWKEPVISDKKGVYVVSLSPDPEQNITHPFCEIKEAVYGNWRRLSELILSQDLIEKELNNYWKPNENILYIGESSSKTSSLKIRVGQFYSHEVGHKGPHTGGYWIKLLAQLENLYVYYAECDRPRDTEFKMLMYFIEESTNQKFYDIENLGTSLPFANLKVDFLKDHGIKNAVPKKVKSNT